MLERIVELLGGIFGRSVFTDRFLYRRLDCCGPTSRQRWKLRKQSWKNCKAVLLTGAAFFTSAGLWRLTETRGLADT
jgi:hypothetical protein